jgi:hypothetical protein
MEARDFALNVWGQTLWELKHTTLLVLGNQVIADLEKLKDSMPPDIKDLYEEWKDKGYPVILRSVTARMKVGSPSPPKSEIAANVYSTLQRKQNRPRSHIATRD